MGEASAGTAARSPAGGADTRMQDQLLRYAHDLRTALARSRDAADALARTHLETVAALAAAVDVRDEVTGGHVYRVANYGVLMAELVAPELRDDPQLIYGFLLHDIGKLAVPDDILRKEETLTGDEYATLQTHVTHGVRFIKRVAFLRPALTIISTHHERWDGQGYPQRLRGAEIPVGARLFAVCDSLDAMLHDRPYRSALDPDEALAELQRCAGTQFDPEMVAAVAEHYDALLAVPDRPPIPGLRRASVGNRPSGSRVIGSPVLAAMDNPMVVLGRNGRILEVNTAFLTRFGLDLAPIGLSLRDCVLRAADLFADPDRARDQMTRLELDLFQGRREGRLALAVAGGPQTSGVGVHDLHWYSKLLDVRDGTSPCRVVVFEETTQPATTSGHDARGTATSTGDAPHGHDLSSAIDALADVLGTDPDQPGWEQRAERARAGLERIQRWVDDLGDAG